MHDFFRETNEWINDHHTSSAIKRNLLTEAEFKFKGNKKDTRAKLMDAIEVSLLMRYSQ